MSSSYPQPQPPLSPWDNNFGTTFPSQHSGSYSHQQPLQQQPPSQQQQQQHQTPSSSPSSSSSYPVPQFPPHQLQQQQQQQQSALIMNTLSNQPSYQPYYPPQQQAYGAGIASGAVGVGVGGASQGVAPAMGMGMSSFMMSSLSSVDQFNMATSVGMQLGQGLLKNEKVSGLIAWLNGSRLKYYFTVSNQYVLSKLKIILCPLLHKKWQRETEIDAQNNVFFKLPCSDVNAPDLYIPTMAFITFVLLMGYARAGLHGDFHPELLGVVASSTIAFLMLEVAIIKGGFWLFAPNCTSPPIIDLVAYSAYKYVGFILEIIAALLAGYYAAYGAIFLCSCSMAIFMIRTISRLTSVDTMGAPVTSNKYFVISVGVLQILLTVYLVRL